MLYFVVHILVYGIAAILALRLTPGVEVGNTLGILEWPLVGIVFGLLNAIIRPVIVLFTGRLIIRTLGVFLVVINAILLWLLAWIFGWQVDAALWLLWGGLVVGILMAVMDALFGLNRPLIKDNAENSRIWNGMIKLSGNRSNTLIANLRLQQVYDIIYSYGSAILLDRVPVVGTVRAWFGKWIYRDEESSIAGLSTAAQVRVMLQTLGPTFVKFGQMVSSRAEALPPEWQSELAKLQSNVPPFPSAEAIEIVEAELKHPINELFASFTAEPFAAASTAQVHHATLHTGERVVVKVQRPNIGPKINADLEILGDLLHTLQGRINWMQENDVLGIFDEFAKNLREEIDYRIESFNARRLEDNMTVFPEVKVPKMYGHLTTAKVLTMEYVQGVKIIKVDEIEGAGWDPKHVSRVFLNVMIKQLIFDGYFHGDAHPGNILFNLSTGQITFLDMGMMGTMNQGQRMNLADLIWTLNTGDPYELSESLLRLATPFHDVDVPKFRDDIENVVVRYLKYPDEAGSLSAVLNGVFGVLADNGLRLGRDLTMALKTLIQAEQIVHILDRDLNIQVEAFADIQVFLSEQFTTENVKSQVQTQVTRSVKELVRRIPDLQQATMQWITQYEKGKFEVELNTDELNERLDIFNLAAQRLAVGMVLLGMIIGSAFATGIDGTFLGVQLSVVAFVVFVFSLAIGVWMVIRMMRDMGKRPPRPPKINY